MTAATTAVDFAIGATPPDSKPDRYSGRGDIGVQQGKHPSVDAVRVALGNTGSKTTIHRYLKEL
ncbi:DNA-binding protein [Xanthomonas translucens]|uniref:DNA-binding protein n=1 Tax=Xanthomonas campestris pv. translucens TaxID=343 RepID=UPI003CE4F150